MAEVLYEIDNPSLHSTLTASFTGAGSLELAGHDFGKFVEGIMGASEYEYWLTIEASHLMQLAKELSKQIKRPLPNDEKLEPFILEALKILYAKDQPFKFSTSTEFQLWLEKREIPSKFFCYS